MAAAEPPRLVVRDVAGWRAWLADHVDDRDGVWLVLAKKGTTDPTDLTYDHALEEALCQGWIDGTKRRLDDATYQQRFTPRRARSAWSKRNVTIAERLIGEHRMQPSGLAEVERARSDGRCAAAYAGPATIEVPPDLAAALAQHPSAQSMFDVLTSANRFAIVWRVEEAKRPQTRARRIAQYVDMLARGETPHPQRRRPGIPGADR